MFKKLLVALDHSATAEQALAPAAAIACALGARVDVALVHEQPALAALRHSAWNEEQAVVERRYLERITLQLQDDGVAQARYALLEGDVVTALTERARDIDADLIVMTSHGRTGFNRALLGSVADCLVRKSSVPVLMIRHPDALAHPPEATPLFNRILVPLDGSAYSMEALAPAAALARCNRASLVLLRVVEPVPLFSLPAVEDVTSGVAPACATSIQDIVATEAICAAAREELAVVAARLADDGIGAVEAQVVVAPRVAPAIADFAEARHMALIAMSTHGRGASRWLIGSVADEVLRSSRLPVLFAHPARAHAEAQQERSDGRANTSHTVDHGAPRAFAPGDEKTLSTHPTR